MTELSTTEKIKAVLLVAAQDSFFEEHEEEFSVAPMGGGKHIVAGHMSPFGISLSTYDDVTKSVHKIDLMPDNIQWLQELINKHKAAKVIQHGRKKQEARLAEESKDTAAQEKMAERKINALNREREIALEAKRREEAEAKEKVKKDDEY